MTNKTWMLGPCATTTSKTLMKAVENALGSKMQ